MINWRTYQNYLLLFAIAFKTLILGTMLTLATHNICLGQLLNDDINWAQIVGKQRKRDHESSHHVSFNYKAIIPQTGNNILSLKIIALPVLFFLWQVCTSCRLAAISRFVESLLRYTPDKIFIRNRAIVR